MYRPEMYSVKLSSAILVIIWFVNHCMINHMNEALYDNLLQISNQADNITETEANVVLTAV